MKEKILNTNKIRLKILELLFNSKASHLGSSMSVVEILITAYSLLDIDKIKKKTDDRSRVFVSKGHSACATYTVMNAFGLIGEKELSGFHKDNSYLAGHVSHSASCVEHSTGALGHGVSVSVGSAIGLIAQNFKSGPLSICICGDGEIQEGSVWEAFMLAGHLKLKNFLLFVDYNKISSIKSTNEVVNLEPLKDKFLSFGFDCSVVDGHSIVKMSDAIKNRDKNKPLALVCNTIKGKGVSFAENEPIWHYRTLDEELYKKSVNDLLDK